MSMLRRSASLLVPPALVLYAYALLSDEGAAWNTLTDLPATQLCLIFAASLANYGLRFLRWSSYIRTLGRRPSFLKHLICYIAGFALTLTPAKAGEAVRLVYLRPHGVTYRAGLAALFAERLLDLLAIALLSIFAARLLHANRSLPWIALLAIALLAIMAGHPAAIRQILNTARHASGRMRTGLRQLARLQKSARSLLAPPAMTGGLVVGLLAWAAEGYGLALVVRALGAPLETATAVGIYAASVLAGALSFLPAGLGSTEAVMTSLLLVAGVPLPAALAATVLCRVATLWFAVVLGLVATTLVYFTRSGSPNPATLSP